MTRARAFGRWLPRLDARTVLCIVYLVKMGYACVAVLALAVSATESKGLSLPLDVVSRKLPAQSSRKLPVQSKQPNQVVIDAYLLPGVFPAAPLI